MIDHSLNGVLNGTILLAGVIAAGLLIWILLSPFGFAARVAGEMTGLPRLLALQRVLGLRQLFGWPGAWFTAVQMRVDPNARKVALRVVIDERLTHLRRSMIGVQESIASVTDRVARLGAGGPAELHADIEGLQAQIKDVSQLGGEIPDDLIKTYQERSRSSVGLIISAFLLIAISIVNGTLLNQYSQAMIPGYLGPVPMSLMFSVGLVLAEAASGYGLAYLSTDLRKEKTRFRRWFLVGAAILIAVVEAAIFALMGQSFPLQETTATSLHIPAEWPGLLGPFFVITTTTIGYILHGQIDERADTVGAQKLRHDVEATNKFVKSLPKRWQDIQGHAQNARSAIDGYSRSHGTREASDPGTGAINDLAGRLAIERATFVDAIAAAKIEDWRSVIEASDGDLRRESARNFFLLMGTVIAVTVAILALTWLLRQSFVAVSWHDSLRRWVLTTIIPVWGLWCLSTIIVLAAYACGFMCFGRLHNVDAETGRAFPLRTSRAETAGAITLVAFIAIGLLWSGLRAFGWLGIGAALLLAGGLVVIVLLGYHMERSARAFVSAARVASAMVAAGIAGLIAIIANAMAWIIAIMFWVIWVILRVLEAPTRVVIGLINNRKQGRPLAVTRDAQLTA